MCLLYVFFFQAEDGIRDLVRSRGLGDVYKRQLKGLTTAIEPLIMIVLGVGVGFLIIAIILPIYSLTSQF